MSPESKLTSKILKTVRSTISFASFRTNQYKQVVQKKIDLGAINKKIEQLQTELGKQIDELNRAGQTEFLQNHETASLLEKLLSLGRAAALLEEEIELIRTEHPTPTGKETAKTDQNDSSQRRSND